MVPSTALGDVSLREPVIARLDNVHLLYRTSSRLEFVTAEVFFFLQQASLCGHMLFCCVPKLRMGWNLTEQRELPEEQPLLLVFAAKGFRAQWTGYKKWQQKQVNSFLRDLFQLYGLYYYRKTGVVPELAQIRVDPPFRSFQFWLSSDIWEFKGHIMLQIVAINNNTTTWKFTCFACDMIVSYYEICRVCLGRWSLWCALALSWWLWPIPDACEENKIKILETSWPWGTVPPPTC